MGRFFPLFVLVFFAAACGLLAFALVLFWGLADRGSSAGGVRSGVEVATSASSQATSLWVDAPAAAAVAEPPPPAVYTARQLFDRSPVQGTVLVVTGMIAEVGVSNFSTEALWGIPPNSSWIALGDPGEDRADCIVVYLHGVPGTWSAGDVFRARGTYRGRTPAGVPLVYGGE